MERIKRIIIVTVNEHNCSKYLTANIATIKNIEILYISQKRTISIRKHLWRLLKRRGILIFADNLLFALSSLYPFKFVLGPCPPVDGNYVEKTNYRWPAFDKNDWDKIPNSIVRTSVDNVNSDEVRQMIGNFHPDLILLAGAPIISSRVIELAKYGVLNPHQGITPRYAGTSPTIWPIYENHIQDIGYTIHFVVPQVDSGPIIEQNRLPWRVDWSWQTLGRYTGQIMYDRFIAIVQDWIISGNIPLTCPQEVNSTRPPAGYFVSRIAEKHKASIFYQGNHIIVPPEWNQEVQKKIKFSDLAF